VREDYSEQDTAWGAFPHDHARKHGGRYDELSELSVGQKCTALLIIALCDGTMPVIIDQPEDALDIVSVWEDVAKKLRRGKETRQFILTTHNASVAVGADSDQFIVLKAGANEGRVAAAGAIDRPEVREAVIQHLEGGPEPYELRQRKYNIATRL
jgi:ABC-type cobalamin/Fe3+-siderophores transport system ATPase subunit